MLLLNQNDQLTCMCLSAVTVCDARSLLVVLWFGAQQQCLLARLGVNPVDWPTCTIVVQYRCASTTSCTCTLLEAGCVLAA